MLGLDRRKQALVLLTIQNASVSLLTRYSLTHVTYSSSTAVLATELVKFAISLLMQSRERQRMYKGRGTLVGHAYEGLNELVCDQRDEMLRMAVPAGMYSFQNTLLYVALSNLTAEVYQTTYQLKLLTTAIFSIVFFQTRLPRLKWLSLLILTFGVVLVQLEPNPPTLDLNSNDKILLTRDRGGRRQDPRTGFLAIFFACLCSGLAGAWFEKVLKNLTPPSSPRISKPSRTRVEPKPVETVGGSCSLWTRNLQLAFPSIGFALIGVWFSGGQLRGTWQGFEEPIVWLVILNQAIGGLLVALVVKEASSIDKGFATSIAIVLSTLANSIVTRRFPSAWFLGGAGMVIASTGLYSLA
ncbi:uncharacterized protein JCM15063_001060 [Sporobolomyces koalae]|uniref:uncharacterized protein n=1 Tax=Sporobolomyces koalae TaxID=500713 RepID=UPI00317DA6D7